MPSRSPFNLRHEAHLFLDALYGQTSPGFLTLWHRQDRRTLWIPARDLAQAVSLVMASAATMDVYLGMGLRRSARGPYERGKLDDVIGIPGVWDDIDLQGPAHKKERLPSTREEVFALLAGLEVAPSLIVDSGWGIQPHWLFDRPWIFADVDERQMAAVLVRRFQTAIHQRAATHGWTLDATHDLTRVLRIPGTLNHKLAPVPVRLVAIDPDRRYSRADLSRILPATSASVPAQDPVVPVALPPTLPTVNLDMLAISQQTKERVRLGRRADPDRYPSRSEAAWRVLLDLIEAGCSDADIAAIFVDPANAIGEKAREQGNRWLAGEIARARKTVREIPRLLIHVSDPPDVTTSVLSRPTVSEPSEGVSRIIVEVA